METRIPCGSLLEALNSGRMVRKQSLARSLRNLLSATIKREARMSIIGFVNGHPVYETRAIVHDPHSGQFTGSGGSAGVAHLDKLLGHFASDGKKDPTGTFAHTPLKKVTTSTELKQATSNLFESTIHKFGRQQTVLASDLHTVQKLVNREHVARYLRNPHSVAHIAEGRIGNDVLAVKFGGKLVVVDGNHRAAAAVLKGEHISVKVVDMDHVIGLAKASWEHTKNSMESKGLNPYRKNGQPLLSMRDLIHHVSQ